MESVLICDGMIGNSGLFHLWFQGPWYRNSCALMDHHFVHPMANGWDAWDGSWETIWPIPWAWPACLWWKTWSLHSSAPAAYLWSRGWHRLHGYWRKITSEDPQFSVQRLCTDQINLLYHDLRLGSFRAFSSSQLQLHLWCFTGCCSHVFEVCWPQVNSPPS